MAPEGSRPTSRRITVPSKTGKFPYQWPIELALAEVARSTGWGGRWWLMGFVIMYVVRS